MNIKSLEPNDFEQVSALITLYFEGLYYADVLKLKSIFHPDTCLISPTTRRTMEQWLNDVSSRAVPSELTDKFNFEILSMDIVKDQAMVKVYCPLFEFQYIDFLGLIKQQGEWFIVSKIYTDIS